MSTDTIDRALKLEYRPLDELKVDPRNARLHSKAQVRQIARSIEVFDFNAPILIDRDDVVLAGNGRVLALRLLGRTEAPVIRLDHLTPERARAYAIADNKLSDNSAWDERMLGEHFKALASIDLDFSLEATGFSMGEIDCHIEALDLDGYAPDRDDTLPAAGPAVAKLGDVWTLGSHKIMCGSSLEEPSYQRLLGDERVAAVLADPPYGGSMRGYFGKGRKREFVQGSADLSTAELTAFLTKGLGLAAAHSVPGAVHFVFIDWRGLGALIAAGEAIYDPLLNLCVWAKTNGGMGSLYRSAHELVGVFRCPGAQHRNNVMLGAAGRYRTNVWSYPGANSFVRSSEEGDLLAQHPTPKPVALVKDAILDVTARGDLVIDPFLGSGTTLIACERVGRRCRGLELDPLYVDLAIRRWERLTGGDAVHDVTGETFGALSAKLQAQR